MTATQQQRFKRALITGGRVGIGRALLEWLQASDIEVRGTTRFPSAEHPELLAADFSSSQGVREFMESNRDWLQDVDLLICNAGYAHFGFFPNQPEDSIDRQLQLMLGSVMQLSKGLWPTLSQQPGSACVFISSLAGQFPIPGFPVYNAAKAGLSQFAESLMVEAGGTGPQVLNFRLGDIRTDFNQHVVRAENTSKEEDLAWARIEATMAAAPGADRVVRSLCKRLKSRRSGSWNIGDPVQAWWAPLAARWLPGAWMRWLVRRYYRL